MIPLPKSRITILLTVFSPGADWLAVRIIAPWARGI